MSMGAIRLKPSLVWFCLSFIFAVIAIPLIIATSKIYFDFAWRQLTKPPLEHGHEYRDYEYLHPTKAEGNVQNSGVELTFKPKIPDESCGENCANNQSYLEELNEYVKDARDLYAQEGMWRAANVLVVLTFIQLCIGGLTAYFLILTFQTQRRELTAANRSAAAVENIERAHLIMRFECDFRIGDDKHPTEGHVFGFFTFRVFLENVGKTPATIIGKPSFNWKFTDSPESETKVGMQFWTDTTQRNRIRDRPDFLAAGDVVRADFAGFRGSFNPSGFYARETPPFHSHEASVTYQDINGIKRTVVTKTLFFIAARSMVTGVKDGALVHEHYVDRDKPVYFSTKRAEVEQKNCTNNT